MATGKDFLVGIFDDDEVLINAVSKIKKHGIKIHEVYSPFPVHGLDDVMGHKPSNLPIAAFIFGMTGTILALTMQIWMLGIDWPMNIGGKPYIPLPAFIPVTFELTVLISALGMTATFFIISNLKPYGVPVLFDKRSTDNKFVMAIDLSKNTEDSASITQVLKDSGASEVNSKTLES